jgi:hypothetical protein
MTALLFLAAASVPAEGEKFRDVVLEEPYAAYLRANPLLMEVPGAKVIRLGGGRRMVLGVGLVALKDAKPKTRLDGERACQAKALASVVGERKGVQVAHVEKVKEKTVVVIENGKETAKSVSEVMSLTETKVRGIARGMSVVGRWRSKDGAVLYVAMGAICDKKGKLEEKKDED